MLGANHVVVQCTDGVTRMCRIPGKIKKRIWIREGDVVIVVPWEFQDEKADVIWRYTQPQVDWLQTERVFVIELKTVYHQNHFFISDLLPEGVTPL